MKLLLMLGKCVLVAVVAVVVLTVYGKVKQRSGSAGSGSVAATELSPAGFYHLKRDEAANSRVAIMVAPNCPSHESARGRELHAALQRAGVPADLKNNLEFTFTDMAEAERVQKFMAKVQNPLVLVRGWAKGNPSVEDVLAQYRAK
jgi:hypothetical protein